MQPIISVTDLSKTYATGVHALKDINLHVNVDGIHQGLLTKQQRAGTLGFR